MGVSQIGLTQKKVSSPGKAGRRKELAHLEKQVLVLDVAGPEPVGTYRPKAAWSIPPGRGLE